MYYYTYVQFYILTKSDSIGRADVAPAGSCRISGWSIALSPNSFLNARRYIMQWYLILVVIVFAVVVVVEVAIIPSHTHLNFGVIGPHFKHLKSIKCPVLNLFNRNLYDFIPLTHHKLAFVYSKVQICVFVY